MIIHPRSLRSLLLAASALLVLGAGCGNSSGPTPDEASTSVSDGAESDGADDSSAALGPGPSADSPAGDDGAQDTGGQPPGLLSDAGMATSPLTVTRLRCDLNTNPLQVQSVSPRLSWEVESLDPAVRGEAQTSFEVLVASSAIGLSRDRGDIWASGAVSSNATRIAYQGPPLASLTHVFWKVRIADAEGRVSPWSSPAEWTQGVMSTADWGAQWITGATGSTSLPVFRRQFDVPKPIDRALVSICGLGQYELRVNGTNVSDGVLDPGWTNFAATCLYRTYDVTSALVPGPNALAVLLGNGMYNVTTVAGRYSKFTGSFGPLKFVARLHIHFADGTESNLVSDTSWRTAPGPITFANIYGGEDFDARAEVPGWDKPGFADSAWLPASVVTTRPPALVAQSEPQVKVMQEFAPAHVTELPSGAFVYDLGQNFSGWPSLQITGPAGASVRLTPGEILNAQGMVTQSSMGGGPIWFTYTLRGAGVETWHPRFVYTGFRYIQVTGAVPAASAARFPTLPQIVGLSGQFVHTSAEPAGDFTCSDADVNAIHSLILAAIRSNLQSLLTDCPQREKLGWLETGHLLGRAMMFNLDLESLYGQEIANMREAQLPSGLVPDIAPEVTVFSGDFRDSPEWGSAYLLDAWNVYQMYGDSSLLEQNYNGIKRYVDYLNGKATQGLLAYGLGDWYDVGPAPPGPSQLTSAGVTATGILFQDATTLQKVATLLGKAADAAQYGAIASAAANAYTTKFWNPAGFYDRNSQTANAVPLALGMVPAASRAQVISALVQDVVSAQYRVTAGDIGFAFVVPALSDADRGDILMGMLKQRTAGGYLYQIDHGATSLTEAWDAFANSSQNHPMLGHAERWFWEGLAGFTTDESGPGFKRFVIRPQVPAGIDSVKASYHSTHGLVESAWIRRATGIEITVSVPVNTVATVFVPTQQPSSVTEGGQAVATARGVLAVRAAAAALAVDVGSGHYDFIAN